jgi:hypothetical protein
MKYNIYFTILPHFFIFIFFFKKKKKNKNKWHGRSDKKEILREATIGCGHVRCLQSVFLPDPVSPCWTMNSSNNNRRLKRLGCPIRKSTDRSLLAANRGLSQLATSSRLSRLQRISTPRIFEIVIHTRRPAARSRPRARRHEFYGTGQVPGAKKGAMAPPSGKGPRASIVYRQKHREGRQKDHARFLVWWLFLHRRVTTPATKLNLRRAASPPSAGPLPKYPFTDGSCAVWGIPARSLIPEIWFASIKHLLRFYNLPGDH